MKPLNLLCLLFLAARLLQTANAQPTPDIPDVLTEEIARFGKLMKSTSSQCRIEGIQGARLLRIQSFEADLLSRLQDEVPAVQQEAVQALAVCGTWRSLPSLIALLGTPDWQLRQRTAATLHTLTGRPGMQTDRNDWQTWWQQSPLEAKRQKLLDAVIGQAPKARDAAARALRCLATPADEDAILSLLTEAKGISRSQRKSLTEALDRIGSEKSLPFLYQRASAGDRAAAWALGTRPGPDSDAALINGLHRSHTLDFLLNLDRLHSTACSPLIPRICRNFYSIIRAGYGEDIRYPASPMRRVSANLIRRTARSEELVDLILKQMEGTLQPAEIPSGLKPLFADFCRILKPEFIREGVSGCDPLLGALYDVAHDPIIVPRLIALLESKCLLTRIYAALTLGRLQAVEGIAPILVVIRHGYAFSDTTSAASAKHTASVTRVDGKRIRESQTVRWLGYLCTALGHIGTDDARVALEHLASAPNSPRDVRYGSVVGLGILRSPESLPVLDRVAREDIIWMIRDIAKQTAADIALKAP